MDGGLLVATRRDYPIKRLTEDFVMVPGHGLCATKMHFFYPFIRRLPNYARDNHLKRVWVSILLETKKELKMLYYYPPFHLYQRQQYNSYPWTYPGSSQYMYGRPHFFNSPCYRECIRSGADSYFCCYICGFC